jgi:predicted ATPase
VREIGDTPSETLLFGREAEIALTIDSLERSRLVTLWGPPGVGKTRVGLAALARLQGVDAFDTATVTLELGGSSDAMSFRAALAKAMGVLPTSEPTAEALEEALARQGPLVVLLDNVETVIDTAREVIKRLWRANTATRWLLTSREPLRVPGETLLEIPPLPFDGAAIELFVDRARAVEPSGDFLQSRRAIEELVKRLDGLPLAIELCAARASVLSPSQMLADLDDRFTLLTPTRDGPSSALTDAIGSSWLALNDDQRKLLAECSVFVGTFSGPAARAVSTLPAPTVHECLEALVRRALIKRSSNRELGEPRFSLLESIRDYAYTRLDETGDLAPTVGRHAAHYLRLGSELAAQVLRTDNRLLQARLELERDNLMAVYERALKRPPLGDLKPVHAVEAALAVGRIFYATGPYSEALRLLQTAHAAAPPLRDSLASAVEGSRGVFLRLLGRSDEASEHLREAIRRSELLGRPTTVAFWQSQLAFAEVHSGNSQAARSLANTAVETFRKHGERPSEGRVLRTLGYSHFLEDDLEAARTCYQRALAIHREVDDRTYEGDTLIALAQTELEFGELTAATNHLRQALAVGQEAGVRRFQCDAWGNLALAQQEAGEIEQALDAFARSSESATEIGQPRLESHFRGYRGACLLEAGSMLEAEEDLQRAIEARGAFQVDPMRALFHALLGVVRATHDDLSGATRELDSASSELGRTSGQKFFARAIEIHGGHLLLARARASAPESSEATLLRSQARALLNADGRFRSFDVRFALRILERGLASTLTSRPRQPWLIHEDGGWFVRPHRAKVELGRRRPLRRVLALLAKSRIEHPGKPIPQAQLIATAWPGERIMPEAALNRLRVALHALRRLGLEGVLVTHADGYLLDAAAPLEVQGDEGTAA